MSLKELSTGHTVVPVEGEQGVRNQRFRGIKRMVRLDPGAWILPDTFPYFADSLYNFELYPDDVMVMGFPKTGTTWLQEIVWTMKCNPDLDNPVGMRPLLSRSYVFEGDIFITPSQVVSMQKKYEIGTRQDLAAIAKTQEELPDRKDQKDLPISREVIRMNSETKTRQEFAVTPKALEELPIGGDQEDLPISVYLPPEGLVLPLVKKSPRPRILKTHLSFPLHNPQLLDTTKVIYVVRNPKDLLVSYYHNSKLMTVWDYTGSFDEIIDVFINDENFYGPFWSHVKEALSRKGHPNLHVVQYERLKKDPIGSLASLDRFLQTGCSEAQLRKICDYIAFDKMKSRQHPFTTCVINDDVAKKNGGFFRKGQVGDWKNKLTPEQEAKIDTWIQKNTKDFDLVFEYT